MTLKELNAILLQTGYKVAYSHFNEIVKAPFITYLVKNSANFMADDKTYVKGSDIDIELYTEIKDLQVEKTLEDILDVNNIVYESTETYIESEKLFQKVYEVRLI